MPAQPTAITFRFTGVLAYEPRAGQLSREGTRKSMEESAAKTNVDSAMHDYYVRALAEFEERVPRSGTYNTGERYTLLTIDAADDQRVEVVVTGKAVEKAVDLQPGVVLDITGHILGKDPYYRLGATRVKTVVA